MKLTPTRTRTLNKLKPGWQSARKIDERLSTLDVLVAAGLAERMINPDSHFTERVYTKYRLAVVIPQLCENDILTILASSFPEWEWEVRQGNLAFMLSAKRGIVSYVYNVQCVDLRSAEDVKRAGRQVIVELKEALTRYIKGE